jgi:hypothetical protein
LELSYRIDAEIEYFFFGRHLCKAIRYYFSFTRQNDVETKTITIYLTKFHSIMTKLLLKLSGVAFILTLLIATGCEDATPDPEALGPEIEFLEGAGLVSMSQDLDVTETTFTVQVSANIGDNPLRSLTFLVDGVAPGAADIGNYIKAITSNGTSITPNNPISAEPDNTNGGVWECRLLLSIKWVGQTVTYAFEIADDANNVAFGVC